MAKPFRQLPLLLTPFTHRALQRVVFPALAVPLERLAAYRIILIEVPDGCTDVYQIESHLVIRATPKVILFIVSLLYSNPVTLSIFEIIHLNLRRTLVYFLSYFLFFKKKSRRVRSSCSLSLCPHFNLWIINIFWELLCLSHRVSWYIIQGGSYMTGTDAACLHTNQSRLYLNHLVVNT